MKLIKTVAILVLPLLVSSARAQTVRITFDGHSAAAKEHAVWNRSVPGGGNALQAPRPHRHGSAVQTDPERWRLRDLPGQQHCYLQTASVGSLEFFPTDGTTFDLISVDLAEYSTVFPFPKSVTFRGFKRTGQMVVQTFTTDGVIDGTGPLRDFETFYFNPKWKHLVRVEVQPVGYSLDNLVLRKRFAGLN